MLVSALGPVQLLSTGNVVTLGGPRPKALLVALLLEPRQVVSVDRLIDLIWDDQPPRSAIALVHTYVSALRRSFASVDRQSVLATRAPGYVLQIDSGENDLEIFARHMRDARNAEHGLDHTTSGGLYQRALAMWRGPALGSIDARFARAHAAGLDEERVAAGEGIARADLALGRVAEATAAATDDEGWWRTGDLGRLDLCRAWNYADMRTA